MNTPLRTCALAAMLACVPALARAQGGKIDDVERSARGSGSGSDHHDSHDDDDRDCNLLCRLFVGIVKGAAHGVAEAAASGGKAKRDSVEPPVVTYGRYPWGGPRADEHFVTNGPRYRPHFGSTSVSWFKDASSSLGGISYDLEGAREDVYLAFRGTMYREAMPTHTDVLWNTQFELGGVMQLERGFSTAGVALRIVCLDDGTCAGGPDFNLGLRVLPTRPLILSGAGSIGGMKWHNGPWVLTTEYTTTAAVALGRVELGGGWHWLKLGGANAFGGPILTARVWF